MVKLFALGATARRGNLALFRLARGCEAFPRCAVNAYRDAKPKVFGRKIVVTDKFVNQLGGTVCQRGNLSDSKGSGFNSGSRHSKPRTANKSIAALGLPHVYHFGEAVRGVGVGGGGFAEKRAVS